MKVNASRSKQAIKRLAQAGRLAFHGTRDQVRFWRYSSLSVFDSRYDQLCGRIMYNVHALEKSLAQSEGWRPGRGRKALRNLNDALAVYSYQGFDRSSFAFTQGVSVIQRYRERHAAHPDSIQFLAEVVDADFLAPASPGTYSAAGVKTVRKLDKIQNSKKTFYELSQGRSSVREFSGAAISTERVMNALRNAERTPSVCNRQGWRVYWTEDKELARKALAHQRGFGYSQMPEVLLVVTVTNSVFISPVERNQGFVDGGLFAMSVLYGLEAEGVAAVPLNACLYARDRDAVQNLLDIDPSEEIIMFIAIGDHPDETTVPVSDRRPTTAYLRAR